MQNLLKDEIYNILSGKSEVSYGTTIQSITSYLNDGKNAGPTLEKEKHFKKQETTKLVDYIAIHNLWIEDIDFSQYVSEGAEQRVYLSDTEHVLKLNDSIYYSSWKDYFYSLLLYNFFSQIQPTNLLGLLKKVKFYMQLSNSVMF